MSTRAPESQLWDALRGALVIARARDRRPTWESPRRSPDGPKPVEELAQEVGADPDTLHRILRALASDGIFAEEEPGVFRNTEASEQLLDRGWSSFAHLFGGVFYQALGKLDASGKTAFPDIYGTDFWSWLAANPDERATFDRAMEQGKAQRVEHLDGVDWRGDETVVDVGGGNGSLLVELLRRQPGLRGIVFDLPETVRDEEALGDRIEFVEGSFFESVPPGDVYVLSTILHDWDDEQADGDPAHDPRRGHARLAPDPARGGRPARERAGQRQVARPADARALRGRERERGAVAGAARGGRLRADEHRGRADPGAMPLTVGTAGHIDHGKTWLVRALTGKDTDRLPEEKERGISIDLGYAPLELPDGGGCP